MQKNGACGTEKSQEKKQNSQEISGIIDTGRKVQVDVKEVPYNCLRGSILKDGKHLYQLDSNR